MFLKHLLTAVFTSLLLTGIFIFGFRKRGPWNSFLIFFVVVTLGAWAGGIWFPEVDPAIGGVHWLPFFIVGLIVSLLLVAAMPSVVNGDCPHDLNCEALLLIARRDG